MVTSLSLEAGQPAVRHAIVASGTSDPTLSRELASKDRVNSMIMNCNYKQEQGSCGPPNVAGATTPIIPDCSSDRSWSKKCLEDRRLSFHGVKRN